MTLPPFLDRPEYFQHVSKGYDLIVETYDFVEAQNAVGRRLRGLMQAALARSFRPHNRVLEIGCGTGIEAMALASRGIDVVATDLSERMVERTRQKAAEQGLSNLTVYQLAAHELGTLVDRYGAEFFDGAYAHGGVLNMDPRLDEVSSGLSRLVRPGGRFLCTVVNQTSLFETVAYLLALRPRKGFRRLGNVVPIPITRHPTFRRYVIPTRFYSPRAFFQPFAGKFVLKRLEGIQIFLPPWNLSDYVDLLWPVMRALERFENLVSTKPPFNAWGSLFLMEMECLGS